MGETQTPSDQIPKSGDNLKQILIGIFLLSILVYVTFGLVSKKFGWTDKPPTVQTINPPVTENKKEEVVIPQKNEPEPAVKTELRVEENNPPKTQAKIVDVPKEKTSAKIRPQTEPAIQNAPEKIIVVNKPARTITPGSMAGIWKTDNDERWEITNEEDIVVIRVFDPKNKFKNLMAGKLDGNQLILDRSKKGTNGQGILLITDNGNSMNGRVKFKITFNNYIVKRID